MNLACLAISLPWSQVSEVLRAWSRSSNTGSRFTTRTRARLDRWQRSPEPCGAHARGYRVQVRADRAEALASSVPRYYPGLLRPSGPGARPPSVYGAGLPLSPEPLRTYLRQIGVESIRGICPMILSFFLVERAGAGLAKSTVRDEAGSLRVFLRTPTVRASFPQT